MLPWSMPGRVQGPLNSSDGAVSKAFWLITVRLTPANTIDLEQPNTSILRHGVLFVFTTHHTKETLLAIGFVCLL